MGRLYTQQVGSNPFIQVSQPRGNDREPKRPLLGLSYFCLAPIGRTRCRDRVCLLQCSDFGTIWYLLNPCYLYRWFKLQPASAKADASAARVLTDLSDSEMNWQCSKVSYWGLLIQLCLFSSLSKCTDIMPKSIALLFHLQVMRLPLQSSLNYLQSLSDRCSITWENNIT